jgi:hypothetical protein
VGGRWAPTPDPRQLDPLGLGHAADHDSDFGRGEGSGCGAVAGVP